LPVMILGSLFYLKRHFVHVSHVFLGLTGCCHKQLNMIKREKKRHTAHGLSANRNLPKGVSQYLALTMLRMQSQSSMVSMMMALLTCRDSCRVSSDDFISATTTSQLESGSGFL
jgi:hypothetical protein